MGMFRPVTMHDPATHRPVVGVPVTVLDPDTLQTLDVYTPDGQTQLAGLATGAWGVTPSFSVPGVDVVLVRAGHVEQPLVSAEAYSTGGTGGGTVTSSGGVLTITTQEA